MSILFTTIFSRNYTFPDIILSIDFDIFKENLYYVIHIIEYQFSCVSGLAICVTFFVSSRFLFLFFSLSPPFTLIIVADVRKI